MAVYDKRATNAKRQALSGSRLRSLQFLPSQVTRTGSFRAWSLALVGSRSRMTLATPPPLFRSGRRGHSAS
jgi:hypothetical protein